jgi:hypothetical protein
LIQRISLLVLLLAVCAGGSAAQHRVALVGRLLDADRSEAISGAVVELVELGLGVVTDEAGTFRIAGVAPGAYELRVRHIAYGMRSEMVDVPGGSDLAIELRLSQRALELEAIDVEVLRPTQGARARSNLITRPQIEALAGRARHIGDVVRTYIPGAASSESRGGYLCLEFRGARQSRTSGCNYPLVVMDGLPVPSPARFLRDLRLEDLERVEFVPSSEGGARYGLEATYGVLVLETRRSGLIQAARPVEAPQYPNYPWVAEAGRHPTARSWGGATVGALVGTGIGLAAIGCFPGASGSGARCIEGAGVGAGLGAVAFPLVGSALGARFFGATDGSKGRILPSLAMTVLPALLGYAVYVEGVKSGFDGELWLGGGLVVVGMPLVSTLADHLFRRPR